MMPGKGKMTVTGNLRDVMKESIQAANAYVRSRAVDFGIEPPLFEKRDIHVHDGLDEIGSGTHERFIVAWDRFNRGVAAKQAKAVSKVDA